jgi:hypothetical protein
MIDKMIAVFVSLANFVQSEFVSAFLVAILHIVFLIDAGTIITALVSIFSLVQENDRAFFRALIT